MKKLMTMIAAVAMSFGLFAEGEATPLENNWTAPADGTSPWNDGKWTGDAAIATVTQGAGYIELKSGSNALSRELLEQAATFTIASNVFFDVNMNLLGQVMDEIPAVDTNAKLAIFALDPSELADESVLPGLYAIVGAPTGGKWLARMNTNLESLTNGYTRLVVKGYDNVLKAGNKPGFRLFTQDLSVTGTEIDEVSIEAAYPMADDGTITWENAFRTDYLSGLTIPALSQKRTTVLLGLISGALGTSLQALDFAGNVALKSVAINDTGIADLPSDLIIEELTFDPQAIAVTAVPEDAYVDGVLVKNGTLTITSLDDSKGLIQIDDNGTKSTIASGAPYTYTFKPNGEISLTAVAVAATVTIDEVTTSYATVEDAIKAAKGKTATLKLNADFDISTIKAKQIAISGGDMTFDLNGQTIDGAASGDNTCVFFVEGGKLTITDSKTTGKVAPTAGDAVNVMGGACVINAGTFDAKVGFGEESEGTITANDGKFKFEPDSDIKIPEGKKWESKGGYYVLVDAVTTWTATVDAAGDNVKLVSITTNGVAVVDPAAAGNYTINADDEVVVTYELATGYEPAESSAKLVQTLTDAEGMRASVSPTAEAIEYTITFVSEETGTTAPAATNYTVETEFPFELEAATFEGLGKTFLGWTNETYTTEIEAINTLPDPLGAITLYAKWEVVISPEEQAKAADVSGLDELGETEKAAANANFTKLYKVLGDSKEATDAWVASVYGEGNKIPAAKLAATSDDLIAAAKAYDLKVMADPVTITVANAAEGEGFSFKLTDKGGDDPVVAATKVQQLVKYTAALGTTAFAPSKNTEVTIDTEDGKSFKATFVTGPAAGFMKVDLTVEK